MRDEPESSAFRWGTGDGQRDERSPSLLQILLLEDNSDDVELIQMTISMAGIECRFCVVTNEHDFSAALGRDRVDLVLADYTLPEFDGLSALDLLLQVAPHVPLILVSGTLGEEAAIESVRRGATDYVLKNRLSRLVPAVTRALVEAEQKRKHLALQQALEAERQFLKALLESIDEGIVACDSRGAITVMNRQLREIHGLPEAPLSSAQSTPERDLHHADGKTRMTVDEIPLVRALRGERIRNLEMMIVPQEAPPRTIVASGRPIFDLAGKQLGAVISTRDVTGVKRLERQLAQAQKMEAVGRLAGGVAHDFNNLLSVILGYCELCLNASGVNETLRGKLDEIRKAGTRAASLTRQLLAFSRKQIIQPKVIDVNGLLSNLDSMLRRLIGEDIDLSTVQGAHLGHVKVDSGQLEQVLMNLVVNARDAMPNGGKLAIETSNVDIDSALASRHPGMKTGQHVAISVRDTGTGMDSDTLTKIFEPFFTTKEKWKGTGLGLSTVYGIVKQNHGYILAESEPGRGASFTIYFPTVGEPAEEISKSGHSGTAKGDETILILEDEDAVRAVLEEGLSRFGYTVLTAPGTDEAFEISRNHPGTIHLLLSDVVLRGPDGRSAARGLIDQRPGMRVLFMSGHTDHAIVDKGVLRSGAPFIQKPVLIEDLTRKIRAVLAGPLPDLHEPVTAGTPA